MPEGHLHRVGPGARRHVVGVVQALVRVDHVAHDRLRAREPHQEFVPEATRRRTRHAVVRDGHLGARALEEVPLRVDGLALHRFNGLKADGPRRALHRGEGCSCHGHLVDVAEGLKGRLHLVVRDVVRQVGRALPGEL
jgi:hypothetical protein